MIPTSHRLAWAAGAWRAAAVGAAALMLLGCAEAPADLESSDAPPHVHLARRPGVSLKDASVAFVSVDGPPASVSASFITALAHEAAARDIVVTEPAKARYLVRGYLTAYATKDGAAIEYVWDVFNREKQRAQRVNDVLDVKGEGADPWAVAGPAALASVAAKSADDLAAFLSYTPEAVAQAAPAAGSGSADETKPLSYAPLD